MTLRQLVLAKLQASTELQAEIKEWGGAANLERIMRNTSQIPGIYVSSQKHNSLEPVSYPFQRQKTTRTVSVFIVVENKADKRGADSSDACDALSELVSKELCGWFPENYCAGMYHTSGQITRMTNFRYIWQDGYATWNYTQAGI